MVQDYNHSPISLREGHVFIDGVEVCDCVSCTINVTPDTWTGRQLGDMTPSTRWLGYSISGTMTERRSNSWLEDKVREYTKTGIFPEITIQGVMDDAASDYYDEMGVHTITVVGVILTGDIPLLALDSGGDVVEDNINFNAKAIA